MKLKGIDGALAAFILVPVMLVFAYFLNKRMKTAYAIKECDWSSDVCSSDLRVPVNSFEFHSCERTPQVEYLLRLRRHREAMLPDI